MAVYSTSKFVTIDRHIVEEEGLHPTATGEFTSLMHSLTFAIRLIASSVRRAGINDILGLTDTKNIHGEPIRRLDKYANDVINKTMDHCGNLCVMASEESVDMIPIPKEFKKGKYVLCFDPLDGSTNIDVNGTIGTIFSLYKRIDTTLKTDGQLEDLLQPGHKQVAAGYVLYGSSTLIVYSTGNGVNVFTYDPTIGDFLLTFENIKMPQRGVQYSCNEGNSNKWALHFRQYLDYLKSDVNANKKPYSMRYIATAAADIHRLLHYGGVYLYPSEPDLPNGKIRLIYEANPLAFIVEQAGGRGIDGTHRLLDIQPSFIHQTVPFFVGSKLDIDELEMFIAGHHEFQR